MMSLLYINKNKQLKVNKLIIIFLNVCFDWSFFSNIVILYSPLLLSMNTVIFFSFLKFVFFFKYINYINTKIFKKKYFYNFNIIDDSTGCTAIFVFPIKKVIFLWNLLMYAFKAHFSKRA